jgi:intein/homing endonuclease
MTEGEKLAHLAGLIEGEGTITINKAPVTRKRKRMCGIKSTYRLVIKITNTIEEMIDFCTDEFGGNKIKVKRRENTENGGLWKQQWVWDLSPRDSYKLLRQLLPYMICKLDQAALGIEFYEKCYLRNAYSGGRDVPRWMIEKREEYFQKIKEMHHQPGLYNPSSTMFILSIINLV